MWGECLCFRVRVHNTHTHCLFRPVTCAGLTKALQTLRRIRVELLSLAPWPVPDHHTLTHSLLMGYRPGVQFFTLTTTLPGISFPVSPLPCMPRAAVAGSQMARLGPGASCRPVPGPGPRLLLFEVCTTICFYQTPEF